MGLIPSVIFGGTMTLAVVVAVRSLAPKLRAQTVDFIFELSRNICESAGSMYAMLSVKALSLRGACDRSNLKEGQRIMDKIITSIFRQIKTTRYYIQV